MNKHLKKISGFIIIFAFCIIFCGCDTHNIVEEYQLIRIHIRANSNDESDQAVKLLVRDSISEYLESVMSSITTVEDAMNKLSSELENLDDIANSVLSTQGFDYTASTALTNEYFPTRVYESLVVESGYYDALRINLGSGEGDNWWCVIYPPLCYTCITTSDEVYYVSYIKELFDKYFS